MKKVSLFLLMFLVSCGSKLIKDPNPAPIEIGQKRIETRLCGSWEVGENGCIVKAGEAAPDLEIFAVHRGSYELIGCGLNQSFRYESTGWKKVELSKLIQFEKDCVIDIFMRIEFKGQDDSPIPVRGMRGTVTLGTCPEGVLCSFTAAQIDENDSFYWDVEAGDKGQFQLRGCGQLLGMGDFDQNLSFDLPAVVHANRRPDDGCTLILSMKGQKKQKFYFKIWFYAETMVPVNRPDLVYGNKISFVADKSVTISLVNEQMFGRKGTFRPSEDGDVLRFYTVQGRSLVMMLKDEEIVWIK